MNWGVLQMIVYGGAYVEREVIYLRNKRTEQVIVSIGAKLADAVELSQKAKELSANSDALLMDVQRELEELYEIIGDRDEHIGAELGKI